MTLTGSAPSTSMPSSREASPASGTVNGAGGATSSLSLVPAGLALAASLAGLLVRGIYGADTATAEMFRGYDLVTAVLIAPGLVASTLRARRGSASAHLFVTSLLAYIVYTYAYYLFGTGFTDLFLLHVAVFATGLAALVLAFTQIDVAAVAASFRPRTQVRTVAGILAALALALGGMWIGLALANAVTGAVPTGSQLVETETMVRLGMALDLAVLVPLYGVAAVLLWRRRSTGYVLATVAVLSGVLHQVSYMVAMPFQVSAGVPGAVAYDPGEPVIVLLYVVAGVLLLIGVRRGGRRDERRVRSRAPRKQPRAA